MNTTEKHKLNHDFLNSTVIINSLSKSAASFIEKISDKNSDITDNQMKLFKASMSSIQQELSNIKNIFRIMMQE